MILKLFKLFLLKTYWLTH